MRKNATAAIALVTVWWAGPLFAEPISFRYNIQITELCRDIGGGCSPFSAAFPLTMTFDSSPLSEDTSGARTTRVYGNPHFSRIPLERPPVALEASDLSQTVESNIQLSDGTWNRSAFVQDLRGLFVAGPDSVFSERWQTLLMAQQDVIPEPTLSAEGMARLLGQSRDTPAYSSSFHYTYARSVDSTVLRYNGFALFAEQAAPIPEPGTCMLVASALLGVWYRQRRSAHASSRGTRQEP